MVKIKAFQGLRPKAEYAAKLSSPPYDVLSSDEARVMAAGNEYSFLRVTKPEITFPNGSEPSGADLYERARVNLLSLVDKGILAKDANRSIYIYRLTWRDVDQTGYMVLSSVDDYLLGRIKRHEFTRPDKEADRTKLNDVTNAQTGPVFLFYAESHVLDEILKEECAKPPVYDFVASDVRNRFWVVSEPQRVSQIKVGFAGLGATYIADGHHRCAAAANVCKMRRAQNPQYLGEEPDAFFLSVIFPENQLKILSYNRVVTDLMGLEPRDFITKIGERFIVAESANGKAIDPEVDRSIGMYLEKKWYTLTPLPNSYNQFDPIESLDISILSRNLLEPVLGITKPRTDKRIDFVGGIRGTTELVKLVDSGRFKVAFAVPPVSLKALRQVADTGGVMPPKSTWFEPKLRDGMAVYLLNE
ncbi:MAG: DUF1015 family protein [Candidatus Zixiibacteriota bacterium]